MNDDAKKRVDAYTIDGDLFIVLVNQEGQYSIWPAKKEVPAGWNAVGFSGSKTEVSAYIDEHWTDMRPISLRQAMSASAKAQ
jgi:MbtH protein